MKIVENPSLVVLDCTFTIYWPRVYSISQWWNLYEKEMSSPPGQFIALLLMRSKEQFRDKLPPHWDQVTTPPSPPGPGYNTSPPPPQDQVTTPPFPLPQGPGHNTSLPPGPGHNTSLPRPQDYTHPTGIHSCFFFTFFLWKPMELMKIWFFGDRSLIPPQNIKK